MLSPPRSPRRPVSPAPSEALLTMQARGLELFEPPSSSSQHLAAYDSSIRSTPSDLDKPLPLEPFERQKRRTSSTYSCDTTITNILELYSRREDSPPPPMPMLHQPQAYRDTVATLLLSFNSSPVSPPSSKSPREMPSIPSLRLTPEPPHPLFAVDNRSAPSFLEFSRKLQDRRNELVSPMSQDSDFHRQMAYDKLAPPSPQLTPDLRQQVAFHEPHHLPGPMSGTITDVVDADMIPEPLDLNRTSRVVLEPQEAARKAQNERFEQMLDHTARRFSHDSRSTDSFVAYDNPADAVKALIREKLRKKKATKEKPKIMSFAEQKYPGVGSPDTPGRKYSWKSDRRSSIQQGVSHLFRALSISSPTSSPTQAALAAPGQRQKQLAIQASPYQKYGMAAYSPEMKRKRKEERARQRQKQLSRKGTVRGTIRRPPYESIRESVVPESSVAPRTSRNSVISRPESVVNAIHNGQTQWMGAFRGMRPAERRRKRLKESIKLVGPAKFGDHAEDEQTWL